MLTCNHHVIWEDFRILGSESNKFLLKLKESSFIKRDKSPILGTNSLYYYSSLPFWILKSYVTIATFGCFRKYPTIFDKPPEVFCKKGILKNFANFTGKHLCWSLFLIKLQAWRLAVSTLSTLTDVFPCKWCKTFKNTYFEEYLRLLLTDTNCILLLSPWCKLEDGGHNQPTSNRMIHFQYFQVSYHVKTWKTKP